MDNSIMKSNLLTFAAKIHYRDTCGVGIGKYARYCGVKNDTQWGEI